MITVLCRGLLLDMDGVLVDSTPAVARVWGRWAAKFGFDADSIVLSAHGRPSLSTIRELLPHATAEFHNAENEWMEREPDAADPRTPAETGDALAQTANAAAARLVAIRSIVMAASLFSAQTLL